MSSLNLEDFALVDITGLAVQIGNFKILLSDYYFFLLNYVHYQLRWWILVLADAGYSKPQIKAVTGHKSDKAVEVYIANSLVQKSAAAQALSIPVPLFEEDDAAACGMSSKKKQRREEAGTFIIHQ